ncbi:MAG: radical SAM protein [bacterium]|nr:radical SAM protein [bacterium]
MKYLRFIRLAFKAVYARLISRRPLIVEWQITKECNSECLYCDYYKESNKNELSLEQIKKIVDEISAMGTEYIHFTGGEALVRNDFIEILKYIRKKKIRISLNTNGLLFPRKFDELKLYLNITKFSLDGPKEMHDHIRGSESYDEVIRSIELAKSNNIKVIILTVVSKNNYKQLDYTVQIAKKYSIKVFFQFAEKNILGTSTANPVSLNNNEFSEAIDALIKLKKSKLGKYITNTIPGILHYARDATTSSAKIPFPRCHSANIFTKITSDGSLVPCIGSFYDTTYNCADIGFKEAYTLSKLSNACPRCYCAGRIEANLMLSFNPGVVVNHLRTILLYKV